MKRKKTRQIAKLTAMIGAAFFFVLLTYIGVSISLLGIMSSFLLLFLNTRYGWKWSLLYLPLFVMLIAISLYAKSGDVTLLSSITLEELLEVGTSFFLAMLCSIGLQKKASKQPVPKEEESTNKHERMLHTIMEQKQRNEQLEMALLQAETLRTLDQILVQDDTERIINECAKLLQQFHIEQAGVYHLDSSYKAMRIRVRIGTREAVPQTVFFEESPIFYQRLLKEKVVILRTEGDGVTAPVLAAPFVIDGKIEQVLIIRELASYLAAGYHLEFLQWLAEKMVQYYEQAVENKGRGQQESLYVNTKIYRMGPFRTFVNLEREREILFKQSFTCIGMYIRGLNQYKLPQVSRLLVHQLREPDRIAYDEYTQMLYILLPGTEREAANLIRKRVETILREQQMVVINYTMLQNNIAI